MSIDLTNWYLTLPTGKSHNPTLIKPPALSKYADVNFVHNPDGSITFTTPCDGVTTDNTKYARCELRELVGGKNASWSMKKGVSIMEYVAQVDHLPAKKPYVVVGQIHGSSDDIIEIRLMSHELQVIHNSTVYVVLDTHYVLGTKFKVKISCSDGKITLFYNDLQKGIITKPADTTDCYFKVGNYVQSNKSTGDAGDHSTVRLYSVSVSH